MASKSSDRTMTVLGNQEVVVRRSAITPAAYSTELVDPIAATYLMHTIYEGGTLLDPFGGTGHKLADIAVKLEMQPVAIEIEPGYIRAGQAHSCVRTGDSRQLPFVDSSIEGAVTSPAYPNGISDSFRSNENSKRHCLAQDERILTRDLRWVRCGDLGEGDEIMAFDEDGPRRKWRHATVTASEEMDAECVRVHLEDGTSVVCTDDHPWLARRAISSGGTEWVRADELVGVRRWYVIRALTPWVNASTYDAGWLAGMLDGEGCLTPTMHGTAQLVLVQAKGALMDRCLDVADRLGFTTNLVAKQAHRDGCKEMASLYFTGPCQVQSLMPVLGSLRPTRLLERWESLNISPGIHGNPIEVVAVERVGKRPIQSITTSSGTYVGEGFMMHNTYVHRLREWLGDDYELQEGNAGGASPRRSPKALEAFYDIHRAVWAEVHRVLRPGGIFVVNTKDPVRVPFRTDTEAQLIEAGFCVVETIQVQVRGLNHGRNAEKKHSFEDLTVVRKL